MGRPDTRQSKRHSAPSCTSSSAGILRNTGLKYLSATPPSSLPRRWPGLQNKHIGTSLGWQPTSSTTMFQYKDHLSGMRISITKIIWSWDRFLTNEMPQYIQWNMHTLASLLHFVVVEYQSVVPISVKITSLALRQTYDCPNAGVVILTLKNMGK